MAENFPSASPFHLVGICPWTKFTAHQRRGLRRHFSLVQVKFYKKKKQPRRIRALPEKTSGELLARWVHNHRFFDWLMNSGANQSRFIPPTLLYRYPALI